MLFRIVLIGNTHDYKNNRAAALEISPTARVEKLGLFVPDDVIQFRVKDVDEGKAFMKAFYQKTHHMPKRYDYVDGDSFWDPTLKHFLGTQVFDSNIEYCEAPERQEDIQSFCRGED